MEVKKIDKIKGFKYEFYQKRVDNLENPNLATLVTLYSTTIKTYFEIWSLLGKNHPNFVQPLVILHYQSHARLQSP